MADSCQKIYWECVKKVKNWFKANEEWLEYESDMQELKELKLREQNRMINNSGKEW